MIGRGDRKREAGSIGPKRLGDLVGGILAKRGCAQPTAKRRLEEAWKEIVDASVFGHTRVGNVRRGTLEIFVDNAVLLSELEGFHRHRLLGELRSRLGDQMVGDLRFRRL